MQIKNYEFPFYPESEVDAGQLPLITARSAPFYWLRVYCANMLPFQYRFVGSEK